MLIFVPVLIMILILQTAVLSDTTESSDLDADFQKADAVLRYIFNEPIFNEDMNAFVTRAEFVAALIKAFQINGLPKPASFADVKLSFKYAPEIYSALELGWISPGTNFYPDQEINYYQAIKIAVSAIGYGYVAELKGGYPVGYVLVAKENKLLLNIKPGGTMNESMNVKDAKILIYNILNSDLQHIGISGNSNVFGKSGKTLLNSIYDIYSVEGIVTATSYNSYRTDAKIYKKPYIEINGHSYWYEGNNPNLLGFHVTAFYLQKDNKIISVIPEKNYEETISLENYKKIEDNTLFYYDESFEKQCGYALDKNCILVYNGRAVNELDIQGETGTIRVLDNNNDGLYDFVFVESYRYIMFAGYDSNNKILADKNNSTEMVQLNDNDVIIHIYDSEGNEIELDELRKDSILAVAASADNKFVKAVICDKSFNGEIQSLDMENKKIYVEDMAYDISDYAIDNYWNLFKPGNSYAFYLGLNNDIVSIELSENNFQYGYLLDAKVKEGVSDEVGFKIFSQSGNIEFLFAQEVSFDADSKKKRGDDIIAMLSTDGVVKEQLIRYSLNHKGYINHIDLSEEGFDFLDDNVDVKNSLRQFKFSEKNFRYRPAPKSCSPYFNLNGTIIFSIPVDTKNAEDREFSILSPDSLSSEVNYAFEVFDLNESGSAGAVVLRRTRGTSNFSVPDKSYIVEKVTEGILPDGSIGKIVYCYTNGKYYEFYLDNTVEVKKYSKTGLCPGDIIEVIADSENVIMELMVDFDASGDIPVRNSFSNVPFENYNGSKTYVYGSVYYTNGVYAYISNKELSPGVYDYSFNALKNFNINTGNIVKINKKRNEVRPITASEIKSYKAFGNDNDFIVIRQSYQAPQMIFVYE